MGWRDEQRSDVGQETMCCSGSCKSLRSWKLFPGVPHLPKPRRLVLSGSCVHGFAPRASPGAGSCCPFAGGQTAPSSPCSAALGQSAKGRDAAGSALQMEAQSCRASFWAGSHRQNVLTRSCVLEFLLPGLQVSHKVRAVSTQDRPRRFF